MVIIMAGIGTVLLIILCIAMIANAVHSKTAFVLLMGLITFMSGFLAFNPGSLARIIAITVVASLAILVADEGGVLA